MCALAFSRCKLQDQKSRSTPARSRRRRLCPLTVFLVTKQNIIKEWSAAATVRPDRQPSQHRMQDLPYVGSMSDMAIFHQLMPASYLTFVAESAEGQMSLKAQKDRNRRF